MYYIMYCVQCTREPIIVHSLLVHQIEKLLSILGTDIGTFVKSNVRTYIA